MKYLKKFDTHFDDGIFELTKDQIEIYSTPER